MKKFPLRFAAFIVLLALLPAAISYAQNKNLIQKSGALGVGTVVTVSLKGSSLYIVDPFETVLTPRAEVISDQHNCATFERAGSSNGNSVLLFGTMIYTSSRGSCPLQIKFIAVESVSDGGTPYMTFIRVRKRVPLTLTGNWTLATIGKGSWTVKGDDSQMDMEIDTDSMHRNCREANDGPVKQKHDSNFGPYPIGIEDSLADSNGVARAGISNQFVWYRVLPKKCEMMVRGLNGTSGTITLLKLSGNQIYPQQP